MIALLAISVASSAVTMRSHWFALSSTVMSSGLAMVSSLRLSFSFSGSMGSAGAEDLAADAAADVALVLGGRHAALRLRHERAFARVRRRLLRLREDARLLEQRQHVGRRPALDDLAVRDPDEVAVRPDELVAR